MPRDRLRPLPRLPARSSCAPAAVETTLVRRECARRRHGGDNVTTSNLIVARCRDGRIIRGTTNDIAMARPEFHVSEPGKPRPTKVVCSELKAAFFVRSLTGDPGRADVRGFVGGPAETRYGKKLAVLFEDGDLLCGYTQSYSPERDRFFMFPSDPNSNNQRVLVFKAATKRIEIGPAAEALAAASLKPTA